MRRLLIGFVLAVTTAGVPLSALADNQDVASQIANTLRTSGQLHDYMIRVKYRDGTAWLEGSVQSQAQMNSALKMVCQTPGVTRVVNELAVSSPKAEEPAPAVQVQISEPGKPDTEQSGPGAMRSPLITPAERLTKVIAGQTRGRSPAPPPTWQRTDLAQPVPSSFRPMPAQLAAAEEELAVPQAAVPHTVEAGVRGRPIPIAYTQPAGATVGGPVPAYASGGGVAPARYDQPHLPNYSWPSYAAYPNYAALTYPRQYSPTAWPFIGPFYPYPQVPLGWRKVTLEWDDGWWMLDFKD